MEMGPEPALELELEPELGPEPALKLKLKLDGSNHPALRLCLQLHRHVKLFATQELSSNSRPWQPQQPPQDGATADIQSGLRLELWRRRR